jgi:putative N-acetylmannosamine-6-phosphate epimerase
MDLELDLFSDIKEKGLSLISNAVARVSVQALSSQPVDHEDAVKHMAMSETAGKANRSNPHFSHEFVPELL